MEFKKKTIIWEDNNEPPKDYIWAKKDGKFYEYNYVTRSWVESKSGGKNEENLSELQNRAIKGMLLNRGDVEVPENLVYPDLLLYAPLVEDPENSRITLGERIKIDSVGVLIDTISNQQNNVLYAYYKNNPFGESPHTIDGSDSNTYIITDDDRGIMGYTEYDEQYDSYSVDVFEKVIDGETYYGIVPHLKPLPGDLNPGGIL